MASGLAALLDDIAAIAKLAAASLDDAAAAAGKASAKAAGVVVDDAAVTPAYVTRFTPDRELPVVWKIALGSLRNKLLFLLPGALLLSAVLPGAIVPLLMLGGCYLSFEGAEKLLEALRPHGAPSENDEATGIDAATLEREKVAGAIRTDFILSAEIMAIALSSVAGQPLVLRAVALAIVGVVLTVGVYGAVGLLVKMDDIGLHLARRDAAVLRGIGRALVRAMPLALSALGWIGTAAMLWVGGGILVHGLHELHWTPLPAVIESARAVAETAPVAAPVLAFIVEAGLFAIVGILVGAALAGAAHLVPRRSGAGH